MSAEATVKGRRAEGKEPRTEKIEAVEELRKRLNESSSAVLFDFRGLNVSQMTALRRKSRESDIRLTVVKNNLLKRASEGTPYEVMRDRLEGPLSIATTTADPTAPARVLKTFLKEVNAGKIAGGVLDGKFMETGEVEALADLPSREVLLGRLLGTLQAPIAGLPRVLNATLTKLVYALQAIARKKEEV